MLDDAITVNQGYASLFAPALLPSLAAFVLVITREARKTIGLPLKIRLSVYFLLNFLAIVYQVLGLEMMREGYPHAPYWALPACEHFYVSSVMSLSFAVADGFYILHLFLRTRHSRRIRIFASIFGIKWLGNIVVFTVPAISLLLFCLFLL